MSLNLREQLHTEMKLFQPYKIVIAAECGGTCGGTCGGMRRNSYILQQNSYILWRNVMI